LAAVTRASSARSITFGTIKAASTPMMTSTTISSMSVKPRCRARARERWERGMKGGEKIKEAGLKRSEASLAAFTE
jgi:hypothetical protein